MVDFPMTKAKDKQINSYVLDSAVLSEELDYLHHSKKSVPLINQPRHGAYVLTAAGKWTWCELLLIVINAEHKGFVLQTSLKLDNEILRIIILI